MHALCFSSGIPGHPARRENIQALPTVLSTLRSSQASSNKSQVHTHRYLNTTAFSAPHDYMHLCFHRFDAGCRKLIPGSQLPVHKVAAAPAEQMDYIIRLQWKRTVGAALVLHTSAFRFTTAMRNVSRAKVCVWDLMGYKDVSGCTKRDRRERDRWQRPENSYEVSSV